MSLTRELEYRETAVKICREPDLPYRSARFGMTETWSGASLTLATNSLQHGFSKIWRKQTLLLPHLLYLRYTRLSQYSLAEENSQKKAFIGAF